MRNRPKIFHDNWVIIIYWVLFCSFCSTKTFVHIYIYRCFHFHHWFLIMGQFFFLGRIILYLIFLWLKSSDKNDKTCIIKKNYRLFVVSILVIGIKLLYHIWVHPSLSQFFFFGIYFLSRVFCESNQQRTIEFRKYQFTFTVNLMTKQPLKSRVNYLYCKVQTFRSNMYWVDYIQSNPSLMDREIRLYKLHFSFEKYTYNCPLNSGLTSILAESICKKTPRNLVYLRMDRLGF